ncbi:hypothetical protein FF38_12694 [Lucilia cuprina]|uniref:Uncharacterized protein n=1 Tax=Lucilia cuprina TaxID=7375 RepID=A0A0L0C430_LUCCU|nr:hypothetical protein FF38_12694 [Lucilia cuprina]
MGEKYIEKIVDLSHQIQKDESLELHNEADILEFKQNINNYIESYNMNSPFEVILYKTKHFVESILYYFQLTDEQLTSEFKFIVELLEKYKYQELEEECKNNIKIFIDGFKMKFEENKDYLDKPLLEWYERFSNIEEEGEQIMDLRKLAEYI